MKSLGLLDWIALVLVLIGGLNWGLVGLFDVDLVESIFGDMTAVSRAIYTLVGLAALWIAVYSPRLKKEE